MGDVVMARGNRRALTALSAELLTASVSIKTLTVAGRQVTQAVFRQLIDESIVDLETMQLRGVGWGHVRYLIDLKPEVAINLVWQSGNDLRRCIVRRRLRDAQVPLGSGVHRAGDEFSCDCLVDAGNWPFVWEFPKPPPISLKNVPFPERVAREKEYSVECRYALSAGLRSYEAHQRKYSDLVAPLFDLPQLFIAV